MTEIIKWYPLEEFFDDYYVPKSTPLVLRALQGLLDEDYALTITLVALDAEDEMVNN